ncbi:MFS transporter [Fictibacillus gelatini]|uniref:MFS transporter n=1 Tax=Fictibacillus gelatini TaxID=225985 RepID=UPI00040799BE|nr:MFS transporter [Fictibacillus gelatini]
MSETKLNLSPKKPTHFSLYFSIPVLSWALYDFANTIFSSNITTIFFPFYLSDVVGTTKQMEQIASTLISYTNAIVAIFLVLLSPLFGVWMDQTGRKKKYLVPFALISIICTIFMGVFASFTFSGTAFQLPLSIVLVIIFFSIAKFFYQSSLIFYDPMMSDIGTNEELPLLSGFGVAVGYLGTILGLTVYPIAGKNYGLAFLLSGLLFLIFSLPIMVFYKEKPAQSQTGKIGMLKGYKEIYHTFKEAKKLKGILLFMFAYFFFNDAIATTIAMMAPYTKTVFGFSNKSFISLYLVATLFSIVGSFIFGYITKMAGTKRAVFFVSWLLVVALSIAVFSTSASFFWISGALYGISLGAMWVTTRTMIIELTPEKKRGQIFGLFAFSGKISAVIGPLLYGTITLVLADYGAIASRAALGSLLLLVMIGMVILLKVPYKKMG